MKDKEKERSIQKGYATTPPIHISSLLNNASTYVLTSVQKVRCHYPNLFWTFSQNFKMHLLREGFHTPINGILFSSTNVRHHNPPPSRLTSLLAHCLVSTPFREQPPRWHIVQCLALIPF